MLTNTLYTLLEIHCGFYHDIFDQRIMKMFLHSVHVFDLSSANKKAAQLNWQNCDELLDYTKKTLSEDNAKVAISKYAEKRAISRANYKKVHLGLDLTAPVGTNIFCPLNGTVHSFLCDHKSGYGNVIILLHRLKEIDFYTLYGHLNDKSTKNLYIGKKIAKGERFAQIGDPQCNGNWPPHLHLQIIHDMMNYSGHFPGTCSVADSDFYLDNCPNPALLFNRPYRDLFLFVN